MIRHYMFEGLLQSHEGRIIISIIWGLGIAAMFRRVCKGRNCYIVQGPKLEDLEKKIYQHDSKCYRYTPYNVKCGTDTIPIQN
jgi:hypothetical protein